MTSKFSTSYARVVELVDTTDLKSVGLKGRDGSSPSPGTKQNAPLAQLDRASAF